MSQNGDSNDFQRLRAPKLVVQLGGGGKRGDHSLRLDGKGVNRDISELEKLT